jgi:hypothetical protein
MHRIVKLNALNPAKYEFWVVLSITIIALTHLNFPWNRKSESFYKCDKMVVRRTQPDIVTFYFYYTTLNRQTLERSIRGSRYTGCALRYLTVQLSRINKKIFFIREGRHSLPSPGISEDVDNLLPRSDPLYTSIARCLTGPPQFSVNSLCKLIVESSEIQDTKSPDS